VLAEGSSHASPAVPGIDHKAGGSDVRARPILVGVYFGSAQYGVIGVDRDDRSAWRFQQPQAMGLVLGQATVVTVGLASRHDATQERPDRRPVVGRRISDHHDAAFIR
jgi:hypothetical protein